MSKQKQFVLSEWDLDIPRDNRFQGWRPNQSKQEAPVTKERSLVTTIEFEFDLRQGRPAPTRDGRYLRFALIVKEDEDYLLEVKGFRVNLGVTHIYPPMNKGGFTSFPVVDLSPDFTKRLLAQIRTYLEGQGIRAT